MINENQDEEIYAKLIQALALSEEIRLVLDNLRNLGHTQFTQNSYINQNNLFDITTKLTTDLEYFK